MFWKKRQISCASQQQYLNLKVIQSVAWQLYRLSYEREVDSRGLAILHTGIATFLLLFWNKAQSRDPKLKVEAAVDKLYCKCFTSFLESYKLIDLAARRGTECCVITAL
jgi:hypothetical protein